MHITSAQRSADVMQIAEDLSEGSGDTCLMIRDATRFAESPHERLRLSELVARHGREQVMFDLIVQAAIPEIGQRMGVDIA